RCTPPAGATGENAARVDQGPIVSRTQSKRPSVRVVPQNAQTASLDVAIGAPQFGQEADEKVESERLLTPCLRRSSKTCVRIDLPPTARFDPRGSPSHGIPDQRTTTRSRSIPSAASPTTSASSTLPTAASW